MQVSESIFSAETLPKFYSLISLGESHKLKLWRLPTLTMLETLLALYLNQSRLL